MMRRLIALGLVVLVLALPGTPLRAGQGAAVMEALKLADIVAIMREEGISHGAGIGESMLGPRSGPGWSRTVEAIHDEARMLGLLQDGLDAALPGDAAALAPALDFFEGPLGRRILGLESSARRAMLDEAVEAAAREGWAVLETEDEARADRLRRLAEAGDLIEENVVGGLNSTVAFYRGLLESEAEGFGMGEDDMLADVTGQEAEIRDEIVTWLFAYLGLAYGPLTEAELEDYIEVFASPAGRQLNAALFQAFNTMFETLSHELGLAAGRLMQGQDI